jgi:putative iron-regulated protein
MNYGQQIIWIKTSCVMILMGGNVLALGQTPFLETCRQATKHYSAIAFASYSAAHAKAIKLNQSLESFVENPDETGLKAAKDAWKASREPYLQTEVFRFYAGPIDDEKGLEPLINGWPLDEFYIDYVRGAPNAGIINNEKDYPEITAELLQRHNEQAGETAITCGFHAIEFLLWGQDFSNTGPGNRPLSDFTTAARSQRRGNYLLACGQLLVSHLRMVVDEWAPGSESNFRSRFIANDPRRSLWYAVYGMRTFSGKELAGERLLVAWDTQAQEDEHSCFSDNTLDDLRHDAKGIKNIFEGYFQEADRPALSGPGLETVFALIDPALTNRLRQEINRAQTKVSQIPPPFDQTILESEDSPGRQSIIACVEQLEEVAANLAPFEQSLIASLKAPSTDE